MAAKFKLTKDQQEQYLQFIRDGMRRGAAADMLELSRIKVREFIFENPNFERLVLDAEVDATEHVEEALYQAAISGNVTACVKWMEMKGLKSAQKPQPTVPGIPAPDPGTPPSAGDEGFDDLDAGGVVDIRSRRK